MTSNAPTIAVAYLARGADAGWRSSCERFLASYLRCRAGIEHSLYVIFKGYPDPGAQREAEALFGRVRCTPVFLRDDHFDIGAYIEWANQIDENVICVMNTASEILAEDWLRKLAVNLALPNIGLVGATGSYESLTQLDESFPEFPNIHIRSNALMIERELFCEITKRLVISDKLDGYQFESGRQSLTRQVIALHREVIVVGRNGRGYSPQWWPTSDTFRQGTQGNLLVADNQTRNFATYPWPKKREFVMMSWGRFDRG